MPFQSVAFENITGLDRVVAAVAARKFLTLYAVQRNRARLTKITPSPSFISFSVDGTKIILVRRSDQIRTSHSSCGTFEALWWRSGGDFKFRHYSTLSLPLYFVPCGDRSAVVILDNRRREARAATASEGVAAARTASRGDRWGGEGDAIVSPGGDSGECKITPTEWPSSGITPNRVSSLFRIRREQPPRKRRMLIGQTVGDNLAVS